MLVVFVGVVRPERAMDLVHELERELHLTQTQEGADRERIGPQVALGRPIRCQSSPIGEPEHQLRRPRRHQPPPGPNLSREDKLAKLRESWGYTPVPAGRAALTTS